MMKIRDSKGSFEFGNCACVAIAGAFSIDTWGVAGIFENIGANWREGVTFNECQKVVHCLGRTLGKNVVYRKCTVTANYEALTHVLMDGVYIMHFDQHLSLLENGVVYDTYLDNYKHKFRSWVPNGWWVIK